MWIVVLWKYGVGVDSVGKFCGSSVPMGNLLSICSSVRWPETMSLSEVGCKLQTCMYPVNSQNSPTYGRRGFKYFLKDLWVISYSKVTQSLQNSLCTLWSCSIYKPKQLFVIKMMGLMWHFQTFIPSALFIFTTIPPLASSLTSNWSPSLTQIWEKACDNLFLSLAHFTSCND